MVPTSTSSPEPRSDHPDGATPPLRTSASAPFSSSDRQEEDAGPDAQSIRSLLDALGEDRLWLLRQIDCGRWSEWRLDLAALERELGQLVDQARERLMDT